MLVLFGRLARLVMLVMLVRLSSGYHLVRSARLVYSVRLLSLEIFCRACKRQDYYQSSLKCFELLTDFKFVLVELEIATH
jgi:hypothetical protein